jgi:transcriptional regulator GlxA family with amidase domain
MRSTFRPLVAASLLLGLGLSSGDALAGQEAAAAPTRRNVAVVLFPGVELLDFAGPGEVFAGVRGEHGPAFEVYTVATSRAPLASMGFVTLTPQYTFEDCPEPDIVVVPGGNVPDGDQALLAWLGASAQHAELMMSVCNGALVFAEAGLLRGLEVTTHHSALQALALAEPKAKVLTNRRFVDNGRVLTAAGIAAGIDGALHVVERFCGAESAWATARYMEYDWRPDEIAKLHAQPGAPIDNSQALRIVGSIRTLGAAAALAELQKLEPPPDERQLNTWGYWLLGSSRVAEAADLFRLTCQAYPRSANAQDSLSDALEAQSDREGALQAARACLALLEQGEWPADQRAVLHNAAASRIARLGGAGADKLSFACPPCGRSCDDLGFLEQGPCPNCRMQLVARPE